MIPRDEETRDSMRETVQGHVETVLGLDNLVDRINECDYDGADLNVLRTDLMNVIEELRAEVHKRITLLVSSAGTPGA
jgi:hypothetical protein